MPIRPPNLDDRRYADIVAETKKLIPQYCPEWTNFSDADPGMTLVQLFSWMTELIIYRLNKVPDKTYIHFLNFIGEERRAANPAVAPLTFHSKLDEPVEVNELSTCSTRQTEDVPALNFLCVDRLTVHNSTISKVMAVKGGKVPLVRELPFINNGENNSALIFGRHQGIQFFEIDPVEYGPVAYTPNQYLYIGHDDFQLMNIDFSEERELGRIRIRSATGDQISLVNLFDWEYPSSAGWAPIGITVEEEELLGVEENALIAAFPEIVSHDFDYGGIHEQLSTELQEAKWWIRGRLDYERWLVLQMQNDLHIYWKDDRGAEEREIYEWNVRSNGRTLEFSLQDLPPIKAGWTIRFTLVDRGYPAGQNRYLPEYRWYYRRGEDWEQIPSENVRIQRTSITLRGPLPNMATDGVNLRAERVETVFLKGLCRDLDLDLNWIRPVEHALYSGQAKQPPQSLPLGDAPWDPFQLDPSIPPTIGRRLFIGSDLFVNRKKEKVTLEIEYAFEVNGEFIDEPIDNYALQLTYRADDSWRVVWTKNQVYTKFTFLDVSKKKKPATGRQTISLVIDPKTNTKGISPFLIEETETAWLRLELIKANLTAQEENEEQVPIRLRIYDVKICVGKDTAVKVYEEPLLSPRVAQMDYRDHNRRLTKITTRAIGRSREFYPYYPFVDIDEENQSLYLHFDKPLPVGSRHAIHFRCQGEAFLPDDITMEWEVLENLGRGKLGWKRLKTDGDSSEGGSYRKSYALDQTGVLEFPLQDLPDMSSHGFWLRGRFVGDNPTDKEMVLPPLPPITHVLLNTVNAVNLHTIRTERYSGQGIPNQQVSLLRSPIFVHQPESERNLLGPSDLFTDIRVVVNDIDDTREWKHVSESQMLVATKDDCFFTLDPVEGVLTFGNGIRGRMLPVGSNNVLIDTYRLVPGNRGNVGPESITVCDFNGALEVTNLLPASGGRNAETVEDIIQRAPTLLTTRDRAVTQLDFETIAKEASGEISRAFCNGLMDEDGNVEVVILANRREGERIPDVFLAAGLRDHVSNYLKRRCLINVQPVVRLSEFLTLDIALSLRLRPNANIIKIREIAEEWVRLFLDPYTGGLDKQGWPFGGTLYSQDFARMVTDIPEVRHVTKVSMFDMSAAAERAAPGWEEGVGTDELALDKHDLFTVRRVRITIEEGY